MPPIKTSCVYRSLLVAGLAADLQAGSSGLASAVIEEPHDRSQRVEQVVSALESGNPVQTELRKWKFETLKVGADSISDIRDLDDAILDCVQRQHSLIEEAIVAGRAYPLLLDTLERSRELMIQNWLLGLFECHCGNQGMNRHCNDRRFQVEQTVVREMTERFPVGTSTELRYLSLGSGGGLQDFFVLGRLLKAGFLRIEATLYDPMPVEDNTGFEDVCMLPSPANPDDLRADVIHSVAFRLLKAAFEEQGGRLEIIGADGPYVPMGPWHCISAIDFDALYESGGEPLNALVEAVSSLASHGRLYLTQGPSWSNFSTCAGSVESGFWGYDATHSGSHRWASCLGVDDFEQRLQDCLARLTPSDHGLAIDAASIELLLLVCKQLRNAHSKFPITIHLAPQHFSDAQAPALSQLLSQVRGCPVHVEIWASAPPPTAPLVAVFAEEPSSGYWVHRKHASAAAWLATCWNPEQERFILLERH